MSKPTTAIIPWDSGGTNLVAVTNVHQTAGFASGEIPTSGEQNTWQQNAYQWLAWLNSLTSISRNRFPVPLIATNWAVSLTDAPGNTTDPNLASSGAGSAYVDIDPPTGYKLQSLVISARNIGSPGTSTLVLTVQKSATGSSNSASIGATGSAGAAVASGADTDYTMNMLATNSTTSGVAVNTAGVYTRTSGSYLTDGFFVGQFVSWTGFTNGANNQTNVAITALTATAMTIGNTTITESAAGAGVAGQSPLADGTFGLQLKIDASATGLHVKSLRTVFVAQ